MIEGEKQLNYLDIIKDIPVTLPFGHIITLSPTLRAGVAYGMIVPPKKKGKKGKQTEIDGDHQMGGVTETAVEGATLAVSGEEVLSEPTGEMMNFYTEGDVYTERNKTPRHITKILVDGGSVANLVSDSVARDFSLARCPNDSFAIKTVSGQLIPINFYTKFYLTIAGVTAKVKAYIVPGKATYNLLLGRRWMKQVRAGGNYEQGTYEIKGVDGKARKIPQYYACAWHKLMTPISILQQNSSMTASANETKILNRRQISTSRRRALSTSQPVSELDTSEDSEEDSSDIVNRALQKVMDQIAGRLKIIDEEDKEDERRDGRSSDDDGDEEADSYDESDSSL